MNKRAFSQLAILIAWSVTAPALAGALFAHVPLALHRGPGEAFGVVSTVSAGAPINVLWCNSEANWCLVDAGHGQGWAPLVSLKAPRSDSISTTEAASPATGATSPS